MYESYLNHAKEFGEKNTQLDRANNDSGYSKKNCRWVTPKIQANNTRTTFILSSYESIVNFLKVVDEITKKCIFITKEEFDMVSNYIRNNH